MEWWSILMSNLTILSIFLLLREWIWIWKKIQFSHFSNHKQLKVTELFSNLDNLKTIFRKLFLRMKYLIWFWIIITVINHHLQEIFLLKIKYLLAFWNLLSEIIINLKNNLNLRYFNELYNETMILRSMNISDW
jgi:hypothetical protein